MFIIFCLAAFSLTVISTKYFMIYSNIIDIPNNRSSHTIPTPRGAGIIFATFWGIFFSYTCIINSFNHQFKVILPSLALITATGFIDDKIGLRAKYKFIIQFICVAITLLIINPIQVKITNSFSIEHIALLLLFLGMIWSINLFNFMDGIDGIAGTEGLFLFSGTGYIFYEYGYLDYAFFSWSLIPFLFGFLYWNWPSAKIFMGDSGSYFIGYLFTSLAIIGSTQLNIPLLLFVILYGLFWFDTTITLIRRVLNKQKFYVPHKEHAYQRLKNFGWSSKKILFGTSIINIILVVLTIISIHYSFFLELSFFSTIVILSTAYYLVERKSPLQFN